MFFSLPRWGLSASWGRLGHVLGVPWGVLGCLGGVLGASWARLGGVLGGSWRILARLGGLLARLGRILARLGAKRWGHQNGPSTMRVPASGLPPPLESWKSAGSTYQRGAKPSTP